MKLSDAVGIVTGGASGIGRAIANEILANGGKVLLTDIDEIGLQTTAAQFVSQYGEDRICWKQQDVAINTSFHDVFARAASHFHCAVNLVINNAGILGDSSLQRDGSSLTWERMVSVNLNAVLRGCQVAIEQFRSHLEGQEGVIINVSSYYGLAPSALFPEYVAAKAGVVAFTRSLAHLHKQDNIRVVALCPVFVDAEMGQKAMKNIPAEVTALGGLIEMKKVTDAFALAVKDKANPGRVVHIAADKTSYFDFPAVE